MAGASKEDTNMGAQADAKVGMWPLARSFLSKLAAVGIVYGWGYMNWSIAWLLGPLLLNVLRSESSEKNKLRRITAQATAMAGEKTVIMSRLDELPSWVYFPDYEKAEWLNRVLVKVWPGMNHYVRGLFKQTIQPAIVVALAEYKVKGFSFERLVLGRIPPRIGGVKVHDRNTSRNEIILDCDVFYAGDCDISFSFNNIKGGIKDFQIRGMLRVVMKPMISVMPLVGGLQIFYLNNPTVDFNLVGAVDLLDFPGLNEILRKTIVEQIAGQMVLPNKLVIPLSHEVPPEILKTPEPEGVLRIHVVEAKHLMKKDIGMLGKGKSDPYAIISVGALEFKTKTIDNTVNPKWDYWCECVVSSAIAQQLTVHIWDHDEPKEDETLGRSPNSAECPAQPLVEEKLEANCSIVQIYLEGKKRATIEVSRVQAKGTIDTWLTLEFAKHGMVHLRLTWLQLSKNVADLEAALAETQQLRVTSMSTALLILYVDSAKNLMCVRGNKQPDVYLEARLGSKTERTATIFRSCDPVWEQGFTFLVANPETDTLHVTIIDEKSGTSAGVMSYNINSIMDKDNLELIQQPYSLQGANVDSKVVLSMKLRLLKYEEPEHTAEEDEDDHDINELNKKIERQESTVSSTPSNSFPPSPLKKQPSKESVHSLASSVISTAGITTAPTVAEESSSLVDETIVTATTSFPILSTPGVFHRNPSVTSSSGESGLGRIQLTLRYSVPRQKLVVVVHKIANLPLPQNDPSNIPDPYVKLYLLPDRHKETKRKTAVMKDNCNPVYDEQFEYIISQGDLNTRKLEVSVCTQKGWLSTGSNVMGEVNINLADFDLTQPITSWFDLVPETRD